jgi:hypothetical protein
MNGVGIHCHAALAVFLVLMFSTAAPLAATSARTVNPVAGVKTIKIEVFLGGPCGQSRRGVGRDCV